MTKSTDIAICPRIEPRIAWFMISLVIIMAVFAEVRGEIAIQISNSYWERAILICAVPVVLMGWWLQRNLIGRWLSGRGEVVIGSVQSWLLGLLGATMLAATLTLLAPSVISRMAGTPYIAIYDVTGKSKYNGRGNPCYSLRLTQEGDLSDQFEVCVSQAQQSAIDIGGRMLVNGRRTRYTNQMLSAHAVSAAQK